MTKSTDEPGVTSPVHGVTRLAVSADHPEVIVLDDTDHLRLSVTRNGDVVRIEASGELDIYTSARFLGTVDEIAGSGVRCILLDGSGLAFVDSAGLRALVVGLERASTFGIDFRVEHPSQSLRNVLELTGLDSMLYGVS